MEYEGLNVEADPAAAEEVKRLGIRLVPVVTDGERVFHGWNPAALAEFVGVEFRQGSSLPTRELVRVLDRVLEATQRAIAPLSPDDLLIKAPNRDRTIRDLGYHVFRLSRVYRDAFEKKYFPEAWLEETPPAELTDVESLVEYGRTVRVALTEWFNRAGVPSESVNTYYGEQTAHQLLERTAWHAAQHLRQIYDLLTKAGINLEKPLAESDFVGLPLPKEVW